MLELFPGLPGHTLFLLALALLLPALPRGVPALRALGAALVLYFNVRYLYWRIFETMPEPSLTFAFGWASLLLATEIVAVVGLTFHTLLFVRVSDRTAEANRREERLLDRSHLPSVDVFILTVNESRPLLERSIRAACQLDYPNYNVWVLDDGSRHWLRELCQSMDVGYFSRRVRTGFKAGNFNNALARTRGEFILSLDADFKVYPHYLRRTVAMMEDTKVAVVQTPGNLTNPDPIQYNLFGERAWPEEQRVFTDVMEPARDTWDNAFCYGGSFLVRRKALVDIGGMPEDSITEDLYSSYLFRAKGYVVRYLNEELSEGLAAESLAEFIRQRTRWALGTLQCMYLKGGPFRARGLSLLDRLFYLDPMFYYIAYFWPFLLLLSPAVYWWTGAPPFHAAVGHLVTILLPRMSVGVLILYWLTDRKVVPIVSELGRIVGIFYFIPAILRGIFHPFGHSFQVTLKGQSRDRWVIQWPVLRGILALAAITIGGLLVNFGSMGVWSLIWSPNTSLMVGLTVYVLWMLFLAGLICIERPNPAGGLGVRKAATRGNLAKVAAALTRRILLA